MPLPKETVTFNFSSGLDTLDDPNQLPLGRFVSLNNVVFVKNSSGEVGALKKRNGFQPLANTLSTISYIANYNESIVGIGQGTVQQYSQTASGWFNQGFYQPVSLNVKSLIKNSYSQSQQDSVISPNGFGCIAYGLGDPANTYKYAIFDNNSGQVISGPTILGVISTSSFIVGQPKTYTLGSSFFVLYGVTSSGSVTTGLLATQINTSNPFTSSLQTISNSLYTTNSVYIVGSSSSLFTTSIKSFGAMFDGVVASSNIVLSYVTKPGTSIIGAKVSPTGAVSSATVAIGSYSCAAISTCFDPSTSTVYTTIGSATSVTYLGTNYAFAQSFVPKTNAISSASLNYIDPQFLSNLFGVCNIGSIASNGIMNSFYDVATYFSSDATGFVRTDNLCSRPVTSIGVVGSESIIGPGMGLAFKPFSLNGSIYLGGTNQDNYQPSYFLINSTGLVVSQFAYGNAGPFYSFGVPSVSIYNQATISFSYLNRDLLIPQNTGNITVGSQSQDLASDAQTAASPFYSQTGINQIYFMFSSSSISARQAGSNLAITGGFLWSYDGFSLTENNYFAFPSILDTTLIGVSSGTAVAGISAILNQRYQYQALFENMDNQGNFIRSSVGLGVSPPLIQNVGSVIIEIAVSMPRLGYRNFTNPTKVSLFRWSQQQPVFYKLGSLIYDGATPLTTGTTSFITQNLSFSGSGNIQAAGFTQYDSVNVIDTTPDNQIIGNEIIYTNGNVIENSSVPSFISMDVWDERLWGISAEDGSVWYSKPIAVDTPVEMDGNFSLFIPPNQTSQGTSQKPLCLAPLDANQIFFCKSSILFINGTGPDITGANSQYSEPAQIPSQVGCSNPNSIVQTPYGIMFQSDNGIWMLGRDLSVKYAGKEVEAYNSIPVTAAACIPGTSEVRFSLNNGTRLVYDLLTNQWSTFSGPVVQSGAIVQGIDTILSNTGQVYQETPGVYLDGTSPVTMGFTTGWINLAGAIQGYARAYWMDILGTFQSPHTYTVGIAYDYNPTITQTATINPYNVVGSGSMVEQWQVPFKYDQCQSFQLTFTEISSGTAGAGLMVSGISLTYGKKKTYASNIPTKNRTGG